MSTLQTHVATLAELELIAPLFDAYRQFYAQAPDLSLASSFLRQRMLNDESVLILASLGDQTAIGFCQLYPSFCSLEAKPILTLYDLFVAPGARRSGAGRALLIAAERYGAVHGFARMDLTTAKTNLPAQAAYASLGWQKDEVFFAYSKAITV